MTGARPVLGRWPLGRRHAFLFMGGLALQSVGCSGQAVPDAASLAGTWKSSRLATPLHLHANGDWEIKADDGAVLQYGVWRLEGRQLVWFIRLNGGLVREANGLVSFGPQRFELRELDGSVTRFDRLE